MKFLVDAHLPRRLCAVLAQHGHDAVHTLDLPEKNETKDRVMNQISLADQRVVISPEILDQPERRRAEFEQQAESFHASSSSCE